MKYSILALSAMAVAVTAQANLPDLPQCGKTCATSMLSSEKASELGCDTNDYRCLCLNQDFIYGLRDCSMDICDDKDTPRRLVDYGISLCSSAGVEINPSGGQPSASSTGNENGDNNSNSGSGSGSVSTILSTVTSGDEVMTTAVATTTFGAGGALVTTFTSDGSTIVSTLTNDISEGASSLSGDVSSILSDISSEVSGALSSLSTSATGATESSTSGGDNPTTTSDDDDNAAMPRMTAPAGIFAAAGLAALLL